MTPVDPGPPGTPRVSVIMNGYNSARYVADSIASLLAQTWTDWELVFWDNCSEDDTEAIVGGFQDARIRFLRAPHPMTLAEGRNAALDQARGDWLAFLDHDDLWSPDKLARQMARIEAEAAGGGEAGNVGLVYARTQSFSARGAEGETTYRYAGKLLPEGDILVPLLLEGNLVPIVSALVARRAWEAVRPIPAHLTFAEDYWLFVALAARFRVLCVQETCCHYRVHEHSTTYRNKLASHQEALWVLQRFGDRLPPRQLKARQAVYHTLIGLELLQAGNWRPGLSMLGRGSPVFLLQGGLRHLYRRLVLRQRGYA
ncbi:MAG: glycosyltransferase [Pseudomonadota bacterium]